MRRREIARGVRTGVRSLGACIVAVQALTLAQAAPVVVLTPFFNLEYRGLNSVGWTSGAQVRFGANSVTPAVTNSFPIDWSAGTVAWASKSVDGTDTCQSGGGTAICRRLWANPSPLNPHFVDVYLADDPLYRGVWKLHFQNGADVETRTVSLDPAAVQAPKVASITLSGDSLTPTFGWAPPAGATVDGYRVNIFDKRLMGPDNSGHIYSQNLAPSTPGFTIDPAQFGLAADGGLKIGGDYMIEISLIQKKNPGSASLGNANIQAIARMYADFSPKAGGGPVVNLPVVMEDGAFKFNMTVVPGQTYYIDPLVAVGYDYAIGVGDPRFLSVDLPDDIGDGLYDIYGFGADGSALLLAEDWSGRDVFHFAGDGVDRFRVLGIETGAGLDPRNTTAFITGLSFAGAGFFTGTQTPITVDVPATVSQPGTLALMFAAAAAAAGRGRRRFRS